MYESTNPTTVRYFFYTVKKKLDILGIEPETFYIQRERSVAGRRPSTGAANQLKLPYRYPLQAASTVDWATHWWLRQSLSLTLLFCGRRQRPSVGLDSLSHGHVRVHSEGKPEGGLHHQQLQQDHLHLQQTRSQDLKLTVVCLCVLSYSNVIHH